jgi:hypothetical protein
MTERYSHLAPDWLKSAVCVLDENENLQQPLEQPLAVSVQSVNAVSD